LGAVSVAATPCAHDVSPEKNDKFNWNSIESIATLDSRKSSELSIFRPNTTINFPRAAGNTFSLREKSLPRAKTRGWREAPDEGCGRAIQAERKPLEQAATPLSAAS
jgi:hypothetical protein